ncbi:hypothetical protein ABIE78_004272 [Sinorhizobium fredii]|nr:hypothetical protein [Sinorhizobium fredii]
MKNFIPASFQTYDYTRPLVWLALILAIAVVAYSSLSGSSIL